MHVSSWEKRKRWVCTFVILSTTAVLLRLTSSSSSSSSLQFAVCTTMVMLGRKEMDISLLLLVFLSHFISKDTTAQPGFVSIDCGGKDNYTDATGLVWTSDSHVRFGETASIFVPTENRRQYLTLRHFPADSRKYCYTLDATSRIRYLVRATFLYGNFDGTNVYPKFDLSLGASHWSTIVIFDTHTTEVREAIILATSHSIDVCLYKATTGQPFISTVELREFYGSLYATDFETQFFLAVSARINFGADSDDPVRYPYDPFDRIWESDSLKRANYLVDVAEGTEKVSTTMPIDVSVAERPPEKVMQTAVVGTEGSLTYRLNLYGFPGYGWAVSYFSEIEDLAPDETRKFRLVVPGSSYARYSKVVVNVEENAQGKYRLYEPGYQNISFPFVFPFEFRQTNDSSRGPILNALEINKYVQINFESQDATTMSSFVSRYPFEDWAQEGGDPCLPVSWSWIQCNTDPQPKIVSIILSGKNLTGGIPLEMLNLSGLTELWLDQNYLMGSIPDFTSCVNLSKIHLENNQLSGHLPSSLAKLRNLSELYIQNNLLSGTIPRSLFLNKDIIFNYTGNMLLQSNSGQSDHVIMILSSITGFLFVLIAALAFYRRAHKGMKHTTEDDHINNPPTRKLSSFLTEIKMETSHRFTYSELEEATKKFAKRIGSGGYGVVYYGKLRDGKEVAVKVLANNSYQGNRELSNEVAILSKIHHRNLVAFLGYCQQNGKNILVYEFMHNGTLKEHLYGSSARKRSLSWLERLQIAEDAARGIEYLHAGCTPIVIHRDVKSSNILLDNYMRAKVSDFGLSKISTDGSSHVSSIVRGTIGYLDPEYYISQQLTEKSDVYSFGVILLELMSGQEAISNERFGVNCRNIVQWARSHIENGYIEAIIDPSLHGDFNIQSVWKVAEKAIGCVQAYGIQRPTISEVLKEIQETILMEREADSGKEVDGIVLISRSSLKASINMDIKTGGGDASHDAIVLPRAR